MFIKDLAEERFLNVACTVPVCVPTARLYVRHVLTHIATFFNLDISATLFLSYSILIKGADSKASLSFTK